MTRASVHFKHQNNPHTNTKPFPNRHAAMAYIRNWSNLISPFVSSNVLRIDLLINFKFYYLLV